MFDAPEALSAEPRNLAANLTLGIKRNLFPSLFPSNSELKAREVRYNYVIPEMQQRLDRLFCSDGGRDTGVGAKRLCAGSCPHGERALPCPLPRRPESREGCLLTDVVSTVTAESVLKTPPQVWV